MRYHKSAKCKVQSAKCKVQSAKYLILIIFVILIFISGCGREPVVKKTKPLMGTWVSIKVRDSFRNPEKLSQLIDKAFSGMEKVDGLMSRFRDNSEISRINKSGPNESTKVSTETLLAINKANQIHRISDGAFDITVSPLLELWGFYGATDRPIPSREEIEKTLQLIGQDKILVDREYGYVGLSKEGMKLDLGGIAKGLAVDEAINILKRNGARNALIDAGGDIYCLGSGPGGEPWKIGIKHPRKNGVISTLELKDVAVATSGDYENFFNIDKQRFSHIIDPRTGYPVKDRPISVTVLARDCTTADGLATAVSVLGAREGLSLVNDLEWVEAVIISVDKSSLKIDVSEGLEGLYEFKE